MESDEPLPSNGAVPSSSLSAEEILALERVGLLVKGNRSGGMQMPGLPREVFRQAILPSVAESARMHRVRTVADAAAALFSAGLSRQASADLLGLSLADIDERISAGTLLALTEGGETRLLMSQFHTGRELPGLTAVLSALPKGADATIAGLWLIWPNPDLADLDGNDELLPALSPRDYLIHAGNPERVARLALQLDQSVD